MPQRTKINHSLGVIYSGYILGFYMAVHIGVLLGLYRDNGKYNGYYYLIAVI